MESPDHQPVFLTAEWRDLIMLNYAVDPALLSNFIPVGTELDAFEGNFYLSLVGFQFNRTRLFGVPIPFHQSFEEVNLRFYVRRGSKRAVVFLREFVPKRAVAAIARFKYNENYSYAPMSHCIVADMQNGAIQAEYTWGSKRNPCRIELKTRGPGLLPPEGSLAQFITEHYWGYAAQANGGCIEYEVQHPQWSVRTATHAEFFGDMLKLYGTEIAQVLTRPPDSAFLADGSEVTVYKGKRIS